MQLDSARRGGADFSRRFVRRLAILFALGSLHGLIWYGDILRDYALLGLLLLPTADWSAQDRAIAWICLRIAWPLLVYGAVAAFVAGDAGPGGGDPGRASPR